MKIQYNEKGQSLILVSFLLIGMAAILALALDGGFTFAKRRNAQSAADAGALAGAREYCLTDDPYAAIARAQEYAITRNKADNASVTVDTETGLVTVITDITFDTYFAHLIGRPEITVEAIAEAGCYSPSFGEGVLPVAWACRPSATGEVIPGGSESCETQSITREQLDTYLANPLLNGNIYPELYIVMDSGALEDDLYCMPDGVVDCDFDNDGENDLLAGGDRSWLDLDGGGGGASELIDWINGGFPAEVDTHWWVAGQTGVANSVFQAVGDQVGSIVVLPIFDQLCPNYPTSAPDCATLIHTDDYIVDGGTGTSYFHIDGFAAFYISCVDAPGVHDAPPGGCPGKNKAIEISGIPNNSKTIEGYFLRGFFPGLGGSSGVDTGVYTIRLTR